MAQSFINSTNITSATALMASDSVAVDSLQSSCLVLKPEPKVAEPFSRFSANADSLIQSNLTIKQNDSVLIAGRQPFGYEGRPLESSFEHSTPVQSLLLGSMLLTLLTLSVGYRYYEQLFRNFFKVKDRSGAFVDSATVSAGFQSLLVLQAVMLESLVAFYLVGRLFFGEQAAKSHLAGIGLFALVFCVYHLFRILVISFLGFTFSDTRMLQSYLSEYFSFLGLWGLFLLPASLLLFYWSIPSVAMAMLLIALVLVARISYLNKGVKIFFIQSRSLFYIILYLCALEIVPLVALFQAMIYFYSFTL